MRDVVFVIFFLFSLQGCEKGQTVQPVTGRYQLMPDADGNAWRIDSITGETKRCWRGTPGLKAPTCITATQE